MAEAARWAVVLFGVWIIAVGVLMALAPRLALAGLAKAGSTNLVNYGELGLRLAVGIAIWLAAEQTEWPDFFRIAGGFVAVTSIMLMLIPRRWHHAYALWWAQRLKPYWARLLSPAAMAAGGVLIWMVV